MNAVGRHRLRCRHRLLHSGADVPSGRRRLDLRRHPGRPARHAFVPRFEPMEVLLDHPDREGDARAVRADHDQHAREPRPLRRVRHLARCSFILYGASPMPEGVLRKALEAMPHVRLMHGYGMTEASPHRHPARPALHGARRPHRRPHQVVRPGRARLRGADRRCRSAGGAARHGRRDRGARRQRS